MAFEARPELWDGMGGCLAVTPAQAGRHTVRAYRWGAKGVAAQPEASFVPGVERWLVQLWPAPRPHPAAHPQLREAPGGLLDVEVEAEVDL